MFDFVGLLKEAIGFIRDAINPKSKMERRRIALLDKYNSLYERKKKIEYEYKKAKSKNVKEDYSRRLSLIVTQLSGLRSQLRKINIWL